MWLQHAVRRPCGPSRTSALLEYPFALRRFYCSSSLLLESKKRYRSMSQQSSTAEDAVNPLAKASTIDKGALHVVSVPIGNLKDFSLRALEVLRKVDYCVCVNRQATRALLELVDVDCQGRLIHYRKDGNDKLVEMLRGGRSMALVSPSGTPCIGDAGNDLVREMLANGVRVTSVPGASAVTSALSVAGVTSSTDGAFYFGGSLPERSGERLRLLRRCHAMGCPCVFFEYPRRIMQVLQDLHTTMPDRHVSVMHELTKMHESQHRDLPAQLIVYYNRSEARALLAKGQIVLVVDGGTFMENLLDEETGETKDDMYHELVLRHMDSVEGDAWSAAKLVAMSLDVAPSTVFEAYNAVKDEQEKASASTNTSLPSTAESTPSKKKQRILKRRRSRRELVQLIRRKKEEIRLASFTNRQL